MLIWMKKIGQKRRKKNTNRAKKASSFNMQNSTTQKNVLNKNKNILIYIPSVYI